MSYTTIIAGCRSFLARELAKWRCLRLRDRVSLVAIVALAVYLIVSARTGPGGRSPLLPPDSKDRVQQVNKKQAKLCLMKMKVSSSSYFVDKLTCIDWAPFEAWYTYNGDVDVIIDLSQAEVRYSEDCLVVYVPDPEIDLETCNVRPDGLKLAGEKTHWWRSRYVSTAARQQALREIYEENKGLCEYNIPMEAARLQAERLLKSLYANVGCHGVSVRFFPRNADMGQKVSGK